MEEAGVKWAALGGAALLALVSAGCAGKEYLPVNDAGSHTARAAGLPPLPPPAQPSGGTPAADQCGAAPLQYLVGKSKDEIPVPLVPSRRRVACTTCMVTMDYRPDRQTIRYDEATKKVVSITCG